MRRWIFVTGGSRGVGAALVHLLVLAGFNVIFVFRDKVKRANEVVEKALVAVPKAQVLAIQCDITKSEQLERLVSELDQLGVYIDGFVLNASGGLEPELVRNNPDYPMMINRDAQVAVVQAIWRFLVKDARGVFVTSHWAFQHGEVEMPSPEYGVIAESKSAGQTAVAAMIRLLEAEFSHRVKFIVVSGDMIVGSPTIKLMERAHSGLTAKRAEVARAPLPTVETMAYSILEALVSESMQHHQVLTVGGSFKTLTPLGGSE